MRLLLLAAAWSTLQCCNANNVTITSTSTSTITESPPQPPCSGNILAVDGGFADCEASGFTFFPQPNVQATNIPSDIKMLLFANNSITALRSNDFAAYTRLEVLDIRNNDISIIEPGTFDPLWSRVLKFPLNADTEDGFDYLNMNGNPSQCTLVNESYKVECTCAGHNGTYQQCPPPAEETPPAEESSSSKTGMIVGIVAAVLVGGGLVAAVAVRTITLQSRGEIVSSLL